MLWVSPKTHCDDRLRAAAAPRRRRRRTRDRLAPAAPSSQQFERAPRASSPRSASTASRPTAATRSTSRAEATALQNDVSAALRARGHATRCRRATPRSSARRRWARRRSSRASGRATRRATWAGLEQAIRAGATAAMSGFPTWGSDIGGYHSPSLDRRRLRPLGAARGGLAGHGGRRAGSERDAVDDGADAMSALRAAAVLHYELFPYLYGLLARGEPVLRPLGYGFPDDAGVVAAPTSSCSSAPTCSPRRSPARARRRASTCRRALDRPRTPATTVKGPARFTRATPLDELPLYARAGAVVPFNLRTGGLVVGAGRAVASGPRRLPRRATARSSTCAASRATSSSWCPPRPGRAASRLGGRAGGLELEPGPAPGGRDSRCTARPSGRGRAARALGFCAWPPGRLVQAEDIRSARPVPLHAQPAEDAPPRARSSIAALVVIDLARARDRPLPRAGAALADPRPEADPLEPPLGPRDGLASLPDPAAAARLLAQRPLRAARAARGSGPDRAVGAARRRCSRSRSRSAPASTSRRSGSTWSAAFFVAC